jgi:hypothetical protein
MKYWVRLILGLALFAAGVLAFEKGLYELMQTGTCASGGPYVSARPCPEGTFENALLLPAGIILGLIGVFIFALRGKRPGAREDAWRASAWLVGWAPFFIATGIVALLAGLDAHGPDASTARGTGIFLAALFIPMGLVPVIGAFLFRGPRNLTLPPIDLSAAAPRPVSVPVPSAVGDPVERLRKLAELRDAGVLSPTEFAAAKSRILAEL